MCPEYSSSLFPTRQKTTCTKKGLIPREREREECQPKSSPTTAIQHKFLETWVRHPPKIPHHPHQAKEALQKVCACVHACVHVHACMSNRTHRDNLAGDCGATWKRHRNSITIMHRWHTQTSYHVIHPTIANTRESERVLVNHTVSNHDNNSKPKPESSRQAITFSWGQIRVNTSWPSCAFPHTCMRWN